MLSTRHKALTGIPAKAWILLGDMTDSLWSTGLQSTAPLRQRSCADLTELGGWLSALPLDHVRFCHHFHVSRKCLKSGRLTIPQAPAKVAKISAIRNSQFANNEHCPLMELKPQDLLVLLKVAAGRGEWSPVRPSLLEFTLHGVRYVWPVALGPVKRGAPTTFGVGRVRERTAAAQLLEAELIRFDAQDPKAADARQ